MCVAAIEKLPRWSTDTLRPLRKPAWLRSCGGSCIFILEVSSFQLDIRQTSTRLLYHWIKAITPYIQYNVFFKLILPSLISCRVSKKTNLFFPQLRPIFPFAPQKSDIPTATTSAIMPDKFIICVSHHRVLFDANDDKNYDLKDNKCQRTTNHWG